MSVGYDANGTPLKLTTNRVLNIGWDKNGDGKIKSTYIRKNSIPHTSKRIISNKMEEYVDMKIKIMLIAIFMMLFTTTVFADGYDISGKDYNRNIDFGITADEVRSDARRNVNYMFGNENYPVVGSMESGAVFLDKSSCSYYIEGGIAYVSCLVYYSGGGADGHGNAAKHVGSVIRFSTYKKNNKRVIIFLSDISAKTGKDSTSEIYKADNGYLKHLFMKVASQSGLSKYLD